jgi:hypothetical protein
LFLLYLLVTCFLWCSRWNPVSMILWLPKSRLSVVGVHGLSHWVVW